MLSKLRSHRPSHATDVAYLALFVALGGSSYAAIKVTGKNVPKDALTGADIKKLTGKDVTNNSLTGADVKNLTGADVANGRLLAEDFAPGQLPRGETGATGAPGSTLAFARVLDDGTVDESRSKNIADANVTHPSDGVYCFDGLGFTPKNVVATPETGPRMLNVFGVDSDASGCPDVDEDFLIAVRDVGNVLKNDTPFHVAVN